MVLNIQLESCSVMDTTYCVMSYKMQYLVEVHTINTFSTSIIRLTLFAITSFHIHQSIFLSSEVFMHVDII